MHRSASPGLRILVLALVLSALLGPPAAPAIAQSPPTGSLNVWLLAPLVKVYEGDTVTIPYIVEFDTQGGRFAPLAPLTPGSATIQAALGSASVQHDLHGGTITYQARKAGRDTLVLQVENALGVGVGELELKVYPPPNYTLDFFIISHDEDAGASFTALFNGSGEFSNTDDTPVNGKGEADLWFSLLAITDPFQCALTPPVQSHASFEIVPGDTAPVVALLREPGYISPVSLSLQFQPMMMNASAVVCAGLGGIGANIPWPASEANADDYGLKNLHFPGEGGFVPYTNTKTEGFVIVTRIEP